MLRRFALTLLVLFATLGNPARAYTPESGVWWNPAEPGTGVLIEIQDNFLFAAAYVYDFSGNATWYTASGFLTGNARFDGFLDAFRGGQCIGCAWRRNTELLGAGGPIRIDFNANDPTRAVLTWGGRSLPIERFQFYLKRPEDERDFPGVRLELTKTLGEWQSVLDFTDNPNADFQFYGDVTVLDVLDADNAGDFVDGCRPEDSITGLCSDAAASSHRAVMEYVSSNGEHILVVDNSPSTWVAYFINIATNTFEGEVSVYLKGTNPTVFYPVRGFRTASRTFVQGESGPSKAKTARAPSELPLHWFQSDAAAATGKLVADRVQALRRLESRFAKPD